MPCGGIYPVAPIVDRYWCFHCNQPPTTEKPLTHMVVEWDAFVHEGCINAFLETDEGRIILDHGHEVIR